jgi:hypothetical protein
MACPAIEELMKALSGRFPILAGTYWEAYSKPPGNKNRLQAAAGVHTSATYDPKTDPHVSGLALDIILFANNPSKKLEQTLAENLVDLFIYYKTQMGWSAVIYNAATTDDFGGPKPYTGGNKHDTHIHIQWPASRANTIGFSSAIADDLDDLADAWTKGGPFPNE